MEENGKTSTEVEWDEKSIREFCNYLYEIVDLEKCLELEKNIRIETGTGDRLDSSKHCRHHSTNHSFNAGASTNVNKNVNLGTYKFKKDEDDIIGGILDDAKEADNIKKNIPNITEKAFEVYSNVVRKAKEEGNELIDTATDNFLRTDIFRIVLTKNIVTDVRNKIKELHCKSTKDITGLANPLHVRDYSLDMISNETMCNLIKKGYAVQNNFIGKPFVELIYKELEFIEFNNHFNEFNTAYKDIRTDFYCWTYINNLDRERQKGLYKLLKTLTLLPFELNKKANLSLQMCSIFQFSYFAPDRSYLNKHFQGGFDKLDNGKKITIIYIPFVHPKEKVKIRIYKNSNKYTVCETKNGKSEKKEVNGSETEKKENDKTEEADAPVMVLTPQSDSLLFLQTRNTTYEISKTTQKFFVINFWISGPVSPDNTL